jgi:hypothetical protein
MFHQRRLLLISFFSAASLLTVKPFALIAQQQGSPHPSIQPRPSPNAPNPNVPAGLDGPQATPPDARTIDRARQQELKTQVSKLFDMVTDLKQQVEYSTRPPHFPSPPSKRRTKSKSSPNRSKTLQKTSAHLSHRTEVPQLRFCSPRFAALFACTKRRPTFIPDVLLFFTLL